jgi:hypothetical protein
LKLVETPNTNNSKSKLLKPDMLRQAASDNSYFVETVLDERQRDIDGFISTRSNNHVIFRRDGKIDIVEII